MQYAEKLAGCFIVDNNLKWWRKSNWSTSNNVHTGAAKWVSLPPESKSHPPESVTAAAAEKIASVFLAFLWSIRRKPLILLLSTSCATSGRKITVPVSMLCWSNICPITKNERNY